MSAKHEFDISMQDLEAQIAQATRDKEKKVETRAKTLQLLKNKLELEEEQEHTDELDEHLLQFLDECKSLNQRDHIDELGEDSFSENPGAFAAQPSPFHGLVMTKRRFTRP